MAISDDHRIFLAYCEQCGFSEIYTTADQDPEPVCPQCGWKLELSLQQPGSD